MTERRLVDVEVEKIIVEGRYRKKLGDVADLAKSIGRVGLLHPIVLRRDFRLVVGARRLAAVRLLKWTRVAALVADDLDGALALLAEQDENLLRKPLEPTEAAAIAVALTDLAREEAKQRQRDHAGTAPGRPATPKVTPTTSSPSSSTPTSAAAPGAAPNTLGKLPQVLPVRTRERIAKAVGVGARTLEKAVDVVKAAESDPEQYGDLPAKMDESGKIDPAYRELRRRQSAAEGKPTIPDEERTGRAHMEKGLHLLEDQRIEHELAPETVLFLRRHKKAVGRLVASATEAQGKPKPDPRLRELVTWWVDEHKRRVGASYVVHGGADGKAIKTVLAALDRDGEADPVERFKKAASLFFGDPYHADHGGYTLRGFGSAANRYLGSKGKGHANKPGSQSAGRSSRRFDLADRDKFQGRPDDPTV